MSPFAIIASFAKERAVRDCKTTKVSYCEWDFLSLVLGIVPFVIAGVSFALLKGSALRLHIHKDDTG